MSSVAGRGAGRLLRSRIFRVGGSSARLWAGAAAAAASLYTTFNPSDKSASVTLSNGNLTASWPQDATRHGVRGVAGKATGKFYFEVTCTGDTGMSGAIGVGNATLALNGTYLGQDANGWGAFNTVAGGGVYHSGGASAVTFTGYTIGDTVMVALDMTNGKLWIGKNGTWASSGDPAAGTTPAWSSITGTIYPAIIVANTSATAGMTANFGDAAFTYTVPTGFTGWTV